MDTINKDLISIDMIKYKMKRLILPSQVPCDQFPLHCDPRHLPLDLVGPHQGTPFPVTVMAHDTTCLA